MEENNQIQIIDKSLDKFKGAGTMLLSHQDRTAKALKVADNILAAYIEADKIEDEDQRKAKYAELDIRANKFMSNAKTAKTEMFDARKALSDLMNNIIGWFTSNENKLDPAKSEVLQKVQLKRDWYVKYLKDEKAKADKIAEDKKNKAIEAGNLKAELNKYIATWLINVISAKKLAATNAFNAITLATYDERSAALKKMGVIFNTEKLKELVLPAMPFRYHVQTEIEEIRKQVREAYDFDQFYNDYTGQMADLKQSLIDRLPSKKAELDEAEQLRLRLEEEEKQRQIEILNTKNKKEKERLEREGEEKRLQAQRDQERLEKEKQQREQDAKNILQLEKEQNEKQAELAANQSKLTGEAEASFNHVSEVSTGVAPSSKDTCTITVILNPGWVELITFWYQRSGVTEDLGDLERKTFKQVKAFAEKCALAGEKIDSKFLKYEFSVKARNVKEKTAS